VKRFALCYRTVVCPVCLSVTLVYCGQTVGWIKAKLCVVVGHGPGHIVLDGDPASPPPNGHSPRQFSAHVCYGQTAGWIKIPLGTKVGFGPGHSVRRGPSPPNRGTAPNFWPMSIVSKRSPISASAEHLLIFFRSSTSEYADMWRKPYRKQ